VPMQGKCSQLNKQSWLHHAKIKIKIKTIYKIQLIPTQT
jgi:hypothetical protein